MIKILATSDWHLGEHFHSSDRLKEQQHFLSWLKQKAATLQRRRLAGGRRRI